MKIVRIITGYLEENCYIIKDEENKACLVVDPGDDFDKIRGEINDYKVLKILLTHSHFDHIGALEDVIENYDVDVLKKDNLEEKEYTISDFRFKVIFTPGHSSDSVTYYFEKNKFMLTGDFLFRGSIGRCDLEGGSNNEMKKSIKLIKTYPKDVKIYPGHGEMSTLKEECENNYYLFD